MTNLQLGSYCIWTGIGMSTLLSIFITLYHKWKKLASFRIIRKAETVIITNTRLLSWLAAARYFFLLSCFGFIIATNKKDAVIQLSAILSVALLLSIFNYHRRMKYKVVFDLAARTVWLNSTLYPLTKASLSVETNRSSVNDDETSCGLYFIDNNGNHHLLYGYSVYTDINNLHTELMKLLED